MRLSSCTPVDTPVRVGFVATLPSLLVRDSVLARPTPTMLDSLLTTLLIPFIAALSGAPTYVASGTLALGVGGLAASRPTTPRPLVWGGWAGAAYAG